MAEQGTPKACSSTKPGNKLAKTIKINFIRTLETNQKFTATRQGLIRKQQQLNFGNRTFQHAFLNLLTYSDTIRHFGQETVSI